MSAGPKKETSQVNGVKSRTYWDVSYLHAGETRRDVGLIIIIGGGLVMLQEFVNHSSDPPEAIKSRLHCSFPTQPKEGHIRHDTKHGTNTVVSVHASQLISAEIYPPLPLSKTVPNTPMEVLLDLGRDHVGFPTYSRDTPPQQDMR